MTCPAVLLLGANRSSTLPERIAAGQHPNVEFLYLCEKYALDLAAFDDVPVPPRALQSLAKRFGPYGKLALWGRLRQKEWPCVLTTGEDIGLLSCLIQRTTLGHQSICIITHGSYFGSPRFRRLAALLRSDSRVRFLCLSESLRQQMIKRFGFSPDRVITIGYGVDTTFFSPGAVSSSVPVRPIVAAGVAKRDYQTLVRAVSKLRTPEYPVKIAADSAWFRAKVDISDATLPPNIEARSYGDYLGLRQLYADAAFVVVPLQEVAHACGYAVIAEAMAMGKAVITSCITGHSDYIVEGETGFYVPVGDDAALRERIAFLLQNPEVAQAMGLKARERIVTHFSLDAYVQRIAETANLTPR